MIALTSAGLGLGYNTVRLERTTEQWMAAGSLLRADVAEALGASVAGIEQIGSSSVVGLLAKPVIDLAVGLMAEQDLPGVVETLESAGWIYRGDAGADGGHVLVLEAGLRHRVAHAHAVEHDGTQWRDYVRFRELLRRSPDARQRYEGVKVRLALEHSSDGKAYTSGKTQIVSQLLAELD